jgi:hypothetical protein
MMMLKMFLQMYSHFIWKNAKQKLTNKYKICHGLDSVQNFMSKFFQNMEYVKTYLDDLLILTNKSVKDYLFKLQMVPRKTLNHCYESKYLQN